jgi:hypothetical protein
MIAEMMLTEGAAGLLCRNSCRGTRVAEVGES